MSQPHTGNGAPVVEFRMPSLGADMESGTIVQWRVKPGDRVRRGDVVAEVETEKGVFEVDLPAGGVVEELLVTAGTKAAVGAVLARLRGEGVPPATAPAPAPAMPTPAVRAVAAPVVAPLAPVAPVAPAEPALARPAHRASPAARRLAAERGIAVEAIEGTGRDHIVRLEDVEHALAGVAAPAPAPTPAPKPPALAGSGMRQAIAAAVTRSLREIPHYYLSTDVDLAAAMRWLATENARRSVDERLLAAPLLLKAVALALRRYPELNGSWIAGAFRAAPAVNIGVAVSLRGGGLIAPAIHDVDTKPLAELMTALRDLVQRARGGGLRASEMTDATVTVTNLGDAGAASVFGIIYPPQVALVGFGRITDRPWAVNGLLGVRPIVTATLAADHRATDGHYGSRFLQELDRLLQHPESL